MGGSPPGYRYVTFAHYRNSADEPGRDARWTTLMPFDTGWRHQQAWVYTAEVVSRLGDYSISGGFTPDHKLFCTGHDPGDLRPHRSGERSSLVLEGTFPVPMKG